MKPQDYPKAMSGLATHVQALRDSGLLHSAKHDKFDTHIAMVRRLLNVPVAVISLIDSDRQIFAGHQGLPSQWADKGETPLTHSFCQHVVAQDNVLRVDDARRHPMLKDNLAIGDLGVVAYLGVPLRLPTGQTVGALAAIDSEPRSWTDQELKDLMLVAALATDKIHTVVADTTWRETFEQLREGIVMGQVVRDASGKIVDWRYLEVNRAWGDLVGIAPQSVIGRTIREVLPGIEEEWVQDFAKVVDTGEPTSFTRQVGTIARWYDGYAQPTGPDTFIVLFVEVTERVNAQQAMAAHQKFSNLRQAALIEIGDRLRVVDGDIDALVKGSSQVLGLALKACRVGYGVTDAETETIEVYQDWHVDHLASVAGLHHFRDYGTYIDDLKQGKDVIVLDVVTDPRTKENPQPLIELGVRALVNIPVLENGALVGVMLVHFDKLVDLTPVEASFVRAVADRIHAASLHARSIAADKLREAEIGHRLKNTMAMVQAIATQTLKGDDIEERRAAFTGRLSAMATAHDALMTRAWETANLSETIKSALLPHGAEDRISLSGPDIELDAKQAMSISLAVHELATNATKYGALSASGGTVQIEWSLSGSQFSWAWKEMGGPLVKEPNRKGFGSRLITRVLPNDFGGTVQIDYRPDGLVCSLVTPSMNVEGRTDSASKGDR